MMADAEKFIAVSKMLLKEASKQGMAGRICFYAAFLGLCLLARNNIPEIQALIEKEKQKYD